MQNFMITLLICSVTMSVLALLFIAITPLLEKHYSTKGRYYAWLIIVIGLIIPFRPQFDNAIIKVDMPNDSVIPVIQIGSRVPVTLPVSILESVIVEDTALESIPVENAELLAVHVISNISWWLITAAIWLSGVIIFLIYHAIKHYRFIKLTVRWSENIMDEQMLTLYQNIKAEMGISQQIGLKLCTSVGSPMMIGFLNPRILLPKINFRKDELRFIFIHELVHYKRKDLWYKCLLLIATAIHWFNPIIHLMSRSIDILCELSCDNEVVRNMDEGTRQFYTETIIGVVRHQSNFLTVLSTNFNGGKKGMKKRIFSIKDTRKKRTGFAIICAALIVTLGTSFAFSGTKDETTLDNLPTDIAKSDVLPMEGKLVAAVVERGVLPEKEKTVTNFFATNVGKSTDFVNEAFINDFYVTFDKPIDSTSNEITMALTHYILTEEHARFVLKVDGLPDYIEPNRFNLTGEYIASSNVIGINIDMTLKDEQGNLIYERGLGGVHLSLISSLFGTSDGIFLEVVLDTPDSDMRLIGNLEIPDILNIEISKITLLVKENQQATTVINDPASRTINTESLQIDGQWNFTLKIDEKFKNVDPLCFEITNPEYCDKNGIYVENFYSSATITRMEIIIDNNKNNVQLPSGDLAFALFEDENTNNYKNPYEQKLFVISDGKHLFETVEYVPYEGYDGEKMYTLSKLVSEDKRPEQTSKGTKYFLCLPTLYFTNAEHITVRVLDNNREPLEVNLQIIKN